MVDLGGYIIILTNDDGKIKLYGTYAGRSARLQPLLTRYIPQTFCKFARATVKHRYAQL